MLESLCGGSQEKKIQTDHTKSMAKKKKKKWKVQCMGLCFLVFTEKIL